MPKSFEELSQKYAKTQNAGTEAAARLPTADERLQSMAQSVARQRVGIISNKINSSVSDLENGTITAADFKSRIEPYRSYLGDDATNQIFAEADRYETGKAFSDLAKNFENGVTSVPEFKTELEKYRSFLGDDKTNQIISEVDQYGREYPVSLYNYYIQQYLPENVDDVQAISPEEIAKQIEYLKNEAIPLAEEKAAASKKAFDIEAGNSYAKARSGQRNYTEGRDPQLDAAAQTMRADKESLEKLKQELENYEQLTSLKKSIDAYDALSDEDKELVYQIIYEGLLANNPNEGAREKLGAIIGASSAPTYYEYGENSKKILKEHGVWNDELEELTDRIINGNIADAWESRLRGFMQDSTLGAVTANVLHPLASVLGGFVGTIDSLVQGASNLISGENYPIDTGTTGQILAATPGIIQDETQNQIQEAVPGWGGEALSFAYGLVPSTINTLVAAGMNHFVPGSGLTMLGLEAASSAVNEASERGASYTQALAVGTLAGLAEVVFEKMPLDELANLAKTSPSGFRNLLSRTSKSIGINFTEEGATEVTNIFSDMLIMREKSNYALAIKSYMEDEGLTREEAEKRATIDLAKQVGLAGLGGAAQGGGMSIVGNIIGHFNATKAGRQIIATPNGIETLLGAAEQGDAIVKQAANAVMKNPSAGNVGNLAAALQQYAKQPVGVVLAYPSQVKAMHNGKFTPPGSTASTASAAAGRPARASLPMANTTPPENTAPGPANRAGTAAQNTASAAARLSRALAEVSSPDAAGADTASAPMRQVAGILSRPTVTASQADSIIKSPSLSAAFTRLTGKALDNLTNAEKRRTVQDSAGFTYAPANGTIKTNYQAPPSTLQEGANGGVPYAGQQQAAQTAGGYARAAGAAGYGYGAGSPAAAGSAQPRGVQPLLEGTLRQNDPGRMGTDEAGTPVAGGTGRVRPGRRLDPTFGQTPVKDWAASALVSPEEGSIPYTEGLISMEYVVPCFVVADDTWARNKDKTPAFSDEGQIYLRESQKEAHRGSLVYHELNHVMKQLGFQPYLDFVKRTPDLMNMGTKTARNLLDAVAEHKEIDPFSMSDENYQDYTDLYDEVNAIMYGAYRSGNTVAIDYLRDAFYDFDAYIAELSDIHQQFKEYQQQNLSTQQASGSGAFFAANDPALSAALSGVQDAAGLPSDTPPADMADTAGAADIPAALDAMDTAQGRRLVQSIASRLGLQIVYDIQGDPAQVGEAYLLGDTIHMNPAASRPLFLIFKHELAHFAQRSRLYARFARAVMNSDSFRDWLQSKGYDSPDAYIARTVARYQAALGTSAFGEYDAGLEMLAEFVAETLYKGDTAGMTSLLASLDAPARRSFIQWVRDFIQRIKEKLQGSPAQRDVQILERRFSRLLRDAADNAGRRDGREYSVPVEELDADRVEAYRPSAEQEAYFAQSRVRRPDGSLLPVYHASEADFTVFDKRLQGSATDAGVWGSGFYFDADWDAASDYGSLIDAYYLNLTNPYVVPSFDAPCGDTLRLFRDNGIPIPFQMEADAPLLDFVRAFGNREFSEALQSLGYDGVAIDNQEFVAYEPDQIKQVENTNPTHDPDIRYSFPPDDNTAGGVLGADNTAADAARAADGGDAALDAALDGVRETALTGDQLEVSRMLDSSVSFDDARRILLDPALSDAFSSLTGVSLDGLSEADAIHAIQNTGFTSGEQDGMMVEEKLDAIQQPADQIVNTISTNSWNKGSFNTAEDSLKRHFKKHGEEVGARTPEEYLRKAEEFAKTAKKGSTKSRVYGEVEGVTRYKKNGKYIDLAPDGSIISFGKQ